MDPRVFLQSVPAEPDTHYNVLHSWTYAIDSLDCICTRYPETDSFTSGHFDERVSYTGHKSKVKGAILHKYALLEHKCFLFEIRYYLQHFT